MGVELLELAHGCACSREGSESGGVAGRDGLLGHWRWSVCVHLLGATPWKTTCTRSMNYLLTNRSINRITSTKTS